MLCRDRWGGLEAEGFGIVFVEAARVRRARGRRAQRRVARGGRRRARPASSSTRAASAAVRDAHRRTAGATTACATGSATAARDRASAISPTTRWRRGSPRRRAATSRVLARALTTPVPEAATGTGATGTLGRCLAGVSTGNATAGSVAAPSPGPVAERGPASCAGRAIVRASWVVQRRLRGHRDPGRRRRRRVRRGRRRRRARALRRSRSACGSTPSRSRWAAAPRATTSSSANLFLMQGPVPRVVRWQLFGSFALCLVITAGTAAGDPFGVLVPMLPARLRRPLGCPSRHLPPRGQRPRDPAPTALGYRSMA